MPDQPDIKRLEMRITELENLLKGLQAPAAPDITPDEMKAYMKVSAALGTSTLRACRPLPCQICAPSCACRQCIVECACGPCIMSFPGGGNIGGGFSGFGD